MIKQILHTRWDFMRWLRLAVAGYFLIYGILQHDNLALLFGGFFLFQSLFNVGCCGSGACDRPVSSSRNEEPLIRKNFDELS
jgi:hypothetical protein